jgi:SpoVK/Ycf46/Vps4 family AAA+-type ATPase
MASVLSRYTRRTVLSGRVQRALAGTVRAYAHNLLVCALDAGAEVETGIHRFRQLIVQKRAPGDLVAGRRTQAWFRAWKKRPRAPLRVPAPAREIARNLSVLRELLGLTPPESSLLLFLVVMRALPPLRETVESLADYGALDDFELFAAASGIDPAEVRRALAWNGRLHAAGLIERSTEPFHDEFSAMGNLPELLLTPGLTAARLVERTLPEAERASLSLDDFAAIAESARMAVALVTAARRARAAGVNLLLHGPTGTGKTEFARLLARESGLKLYLAGAFDDKGESPEARRRLSLLLLGNRLFANAEAMLLFDELEDLFEAELGRARMSKQWFNRMLETNPVPTVWITNATAGIDPAFLRRFSFAIEFRPPGARQRARILARHLGETPLPPPEVDAIAQRFEVAPAQLRAAVTAARLIAPSVDRRTLEQLIEPVDELLRGGRAASAAQFDAASYRIDVLNASEDLAALADRLAAWREGGRGLSMCVHGPPGTGKSEYARYLASRMDRPVVCRRASDLESCWLGETEKNIRDAFSEALAERALLLFDEADSWLCDRRAAVRSWEVTQVNEFLQQLESFPGIVVCTTNLWGNLDAASLRRFVFKVEFRYLKPEGAARLLETMFGVRARTERLPPLAPGDFAAVARRIGALGGPVGTEDVLRFLESEASARTSAPRPAGFAW